MQYASGTRRLLAIGHELRRRTPLSPALLVLLPVCSVLAIDEAAMLRGVLMFSLCGGYLFLQIALETLGQRTESALHRAWGGRPAVRMLRHRDSEVLDGMKHAWHQRYAIQLHTHFPTLDEERRDPVAADAQYSRAVAWSDRHAPDCFNVRCLWQARVKYQFLLHCLALRWIGFNVAMGTMAWSCIRDISISMVSQSNFELVVSTSLHPSSASTLLLCAVMAGAWLFFFTPARVYAAACAYDLHLLDLLECADGAALLGSRASEKSES